MTIKRILKKVIPELVTQIKEAYPVPKEIS